LYLSRVESQDVAPARAPVDVGALHREASRRLQLTAQQRGLQLALDLPELPLLLGNADELDHLFGNLLENAGKYAPPGSAITIHAQANAGAVVVSVHNTGSVIPPADLPHIFGRFYRVDKSRARAVDGSGLGLAIAQEVAQRHNGTITAASAPEHGTTFVVTLPLDGQTSERRALPAADPAAIVDVGREPSAVQRILRQIRHHPRRAAVPGR
ncbi:MAG: sensor histidine kinase, partial [Chloroflexota bacterium]